ncbi:MAG: GNAT family N-acetyltransferase, partial [Microbacterium sp.]
MSTDTGLALEFRSITIPAHTGDADAGDFVEMTRVRNLVYGEIDGNDDNALTAAELLPHYQPDPDETRLLWGVFVDGSLIGRVGVDIPHEEGSRNAFWLIELLREHHGRGIGRAAYALVEKAAREHGRTVLQSWAQHIEAAGPRLSAPTGFGTIPEDRAARFYLANGYRLEQIERRSDLDVTASADTIDALLAEARAAATGYRVVQWT